MKTQTKREKKGYKVGDKVLFGYYPQKKAAYVGEIGEKNLSGYATGSDGKLYEEYNGAYYLVDRIAWEVVGFTEEGKLILVSEKCLEARAFHSGNKNGYAESEIRAWLNGEFLEKAFPAPALRKKVGVSEIKSAIPSADSSAALSYDISSDGAYLLSDGEFLGYSSLSRRKEVTDYAKATGAFEEDGYGRWWLRSANFYGASSVRFIGKDGGEFADADYTGACVVPVIVVDPS